jgi:2-polyprenyl-6-methoxyphenol hydroxylase-like FAD-dependent oxidoreductase
MICEQVGAGPVGLLTAKRLIQAGIPTTILEAQPEIEQSPRAMVYQPIAVRELDKAGILESARQIGSSAKVVSWRKLNGEVIAVLGRPYVPDAGEGAQYETLVLGQHELSNIILQEIEKTPTLGRILFNHRVVELNQQADAVTVVVETGENKRMEFSASYLVAADGGRSTLRRLLGVSFDGFTWPQQLVATNVVYPFDKYGYDATNLIWCVLDPSGSVQVSC